MPTLRDINALRDAGLLPAERFLDAAALVRDGAGWAAWARRALLALGAGQLLAGIVFFFAWNWADMPPMLKFGTAEAGIVLAAVGAMLAGLDRPAGQALLIGASVLTGVLLAVIGQVYSTDADAWQLFAAWTLLMLPWTLASRSAPHWLLWFVVGLVALGTYGAQVLVAEFGFSPTGIELMLAAVAALGLLLRELAVRAGVAWLSAPWTRLTLLAAVPGILLWPAMEYIVDMHGDPTGTVALFVTLIVGAFVYGRLLPDFAACAIVTGFAGLFLMALGGRAIADGVGFDWDSAVVLLTSLALLIAWLALITGAAAALLRALRRRLERAPA